MVNELYLYRAFLIFQSLTTFLIHHSFIHLAQGPFNMQTGGAVDRSSSSSEAACSLYILRHVHWFCSAAWWPFSF